MFSLKDRYDHNMLTRDLAAEKPWLEQLRTVLLVRSASASGVVRWRLAKLVEWAIDPYLPKISDEDPSNGAANAGR